MPGSQWSLISVRARRELPVDGLHALSSTLHSRPGPQRELGKALLAPHCCLNSHSPLPRSQAGEHSHVAPRSVLPGEHSLLLHQHLPESPDLLPGLLL